MFDHDGTLVDTEPLWFEAEQKFARERGTTITTEQSLGLVGKAMSHTSKLMKTWTGAPESPEEIGQIITGMVADAVSSQPPRWRPGIERLLYALKAEGVSVGLVTSSARQIVDQLLVQLPDGLFDVVISSDEVENLKPHPEPYLQAMRAVGANPSRSVVLEDSGSGIRSAKAAGANVVAIPCMLDLPAEDGLSRFASVEDLSVEVLGIISRGEVIDQLA